MKQSDELKDFADKIYRAMESGNEDFLRRIWSDHDGVVAIGTDPREWWKGNQQISSVFIAQLKEMQGVRIRSNDQQVYEQSGVGWLADNAVMELGDLEVPVRLTSVFAKEGNDWKVVQWHASIGTKNEEVLDKKLPMA